jgi:hypothetical protein
VPPTTEPRLTLTWARFRCRALRRAVQRLSLVGPWSVASSKLTSGHTNTFEGPFGSAGTGLDSLTQ